MGEVRGSFDSTDSRDHLHSGLDVSGTFGEVVRAIRSDKVTSPLPNWGFDSLSEGLRVGVVSYIHMHVGRDQDGKPFDDPRFVRAERLMMENLRACASGGELAFGPGTHWAP